MIINLSLSNIINVSVLRAPAALGVPNVNTLALFSAAQPLSAFSGDYKVYLTASDVAADFGSTSEPALQAAAIFGQRPNILSTGGYLIIVPLKTIDAVLETVEAAIVRVIDQAYFQGVLVDAVIDASPFALLATYVQSVNKLLFYGSAVAADIETGGMLDLLRTGSLTYTRGLYYSVSAQAARIYAAAYASRALSTDFSGVNTCSTMHEKVLAGVNVDSGIDQTTLTKAIAAGVDVYCSIAGAPGIFSSGKNGFFDSVYNALWFQFALGIAGFNYLRQTNTKIPQTEAGMDGLKNAYRRVCAQAVTCNYLAPGEWTSSDTFGSLEAFIRCIQDIGYYTYSVPVSQQAPADRAARKAPLVQIAAKESGAIHASDVIVNVNA